MNLKIIMSQLLVSETAKQKKTPLFSLHSEWNARMVNFADYQMPVHYSSGIIKEHHHTRAHAGLFDISHMGQIKISGGNIAELLEQLVPGDMSGLGLNRQRYSVFTNDQGGIIDDCMLTNRGEHWLIVANAARKRKLFGHLQAALDDCDIVELEEHALLALQGPESSIVMERLAPGMSHLPFMGSQPVLIDSVECLVNRCGYTGEDGYEISVPAEQVDKLARLLIAQEEVQPIGLGARDTLRLEAGLCLYGHDIDENTSPIEADLGWVIAKKYYKGTAKSALFPGAEKILREIRQGPYRKRVGIKPDGRAPVREGAELVNEQGDVVGRVTSGGFGPTVGGPIAMGYLSNDYAQIDIRLDAMVRNRRHPVCISELPFVPHRYYRC